MSAHEYRDDDEWLPVVQDASAVNQHPAEPLRPVDSFLT